MSQRLQGDGEETSISNQPNINSFEIISRDSLLKLNTLNLECEKNQVIWLLKKPQLPTISNVAQKLNKVSLFTVPDILSSPPEDFSNKTKILLHPNEKFIKKKKAFSLAGKDKEPKFVPYEPYKGCIKPLMGSIEKTEKFKENSAPKSQSKFQTEEQVQ